MPIDFFNMLDDVDWRPMTVDQSDDEYQWHKGGSLADAPVDMEATFNGAMWTGSAMMGDFWMTGFRARPNFTIPRHKHNQRKLIIVFGGDMEVQYEDQGKKTSQRVTGPGGFFIVDAETPHTLVAGPQGVTYTEQWDYDPPPTMETTWFEEGWAKA
jgi:quercetin dioxygenase-like cupin family protein